MRLMILASMIFACGDKEDDTGSDEAIEQEESPEDTGQD